MKIIKKLFWTFVLIIIFPKVLLSNLINKNDIKLLNIDDEKIFLERCFKKDNFTDTPKCLNFLGIKIFINNLNNKSVEKQDETNIEKISIKYLKAAAKQGYKKAYINLGWIYSNDLSKSQNFSKSSEYFNMFENSKFTNLNYTDIDLNNQTEASINRENIILVILIMKKLNLYIANSKDESKSYLSFSEYEKAKIAYTKIIEISKLSNTEIEELIKIVLKKNVTSLSNLEKELSIFKKKYRRNALKDLRVLINIYEKLN